MHAKLESGIKLRLPTSSHCVGRAEHRDTVLLKTKNNLLLHRSISKTSRPHIPGSPSGPSQGQIAESTNGKVHKDLSGSPASPTAKAVLVLPPHAGSFGQPYVHSSAGCPAYPARYPKLRSRSRFYSKNEVSLQVLLKTRLSLEVFVLAGFA